MASTWAATSESFVVVPGCRAKKGRAGQEWVSLECRAEFRVEREVAFEVEGEREAEESTNAQRRLSQNDLDTIAPFAPSPTRDEFIKSSSSYGRLTSSASSSPTSRTRPTPFSRSHRSSLSGTLLSPPAHPSHLTSAHTALQPPANVLRSPLPLPPPIHLVPPLHPPLLPLRIPLLVHRRQPRSTPSAANETKAPRRRPRMAFNPVPRRWVQPGFLGQDQHRLPPRARCVPRQTPRRGRDRGRPFPFLRAPPRFDKGALCGLQSAAVALASWAHVAGVEGCYEALAVEMGGVEGGGRAGVGLSRVGGVVSRSSNAERKCTSRSSFPSKAQSSVQQNAASHSTVILNTARRKGEKKGQVKRG